MLRILSVMLAIAALVVSAAGLAQETDPERDILVTFENTGARSTTPGAPYRARKRYAISAEAQRQAIAVAHDYSLEEVDHWPIRSLSVYCFVYRVADGEERSEVISRLRADLRIESVQALNVFETGTNYTGRYDDQYAGLQHGLDTLNLEAAHRHSRGRGMRIAIVDSDADTDHEDLRGRVRKVDDFASGDAVPDRQHGTAVSSVIAARTNNAKGIVGVAPEAGVELYVACWSDPGSDGAVCDSFTLAKALDTMLERPPDVLNLSLAGPPDSLLARLLEAAHRRGVVLVAACPNVEEKPFPASMEEVIAVGSGPGSWRAGDPVLAPGKQILVAVPDNAYDFRSGSSLAAAHVSGIVALILSVSPDTSAASVRSMLERSQSGPETGSVSIDACVALQLADPALDCGG